MNPYEELGIDSKADAPTIKRAYRKKAKKAHPDGGGSREAFGRIMQAHLVLSDPVRRAKFDETGSIDADGPSADAAEQAALQEIAAMLAYILQREGDIRDVKAAVLSLLREKKEQIESTAAPLKRALARAKKIEKRWKRKGKGENMLAKMVEWQIRSWADGVEKFEAQIGMMKRSIEILEEYSFEMLPVDKNAANSAYMRTGPAYFATFQVR